MIAKTTAEKLRVLLLTTPEGMTIRDLSRKTHVTQDLVYSALRRGYGFYIAAYADNIALWRCVPVPAHAQRPENVEPEKTAKDKRKEYQFAYRAKHRNAQLDRELQASRLKYEAERQRVREEKQTRLAAKKAEREAKIAAKLAAKIAKNPSLQPAAPAGYQPQKTQWAFPPPWAH